MKTILMIAMLLNGAFALGGNIHKTYSVTGNKKHHFRGVARSIDSDFWAKTSHVSYLKVDQSIPGKSDISSLVSLPEDQGNCGSCWDFSLTKALRSAWMVAGKDPGVLDFNYLLNNCGPGTRESGCDGGDFDAADNFLKGFGPGLNSQNPYTQSSGQCPSPALSVAASAVSYSMLGGSNGPAFKDLAYAVGVQHQMLSIDVAVSDDWERYSGGIYNGCDLNDPGAIDHMINLVGYDCKSSVDANGNCVFDANGDTVNHDGVLLVENNWNESWGTQAGNGHGGYMYTVYRSADGSRCNAISTNALMYSVQIPNMSMK